VEEVHRLQAKVSELTALRDDLIYHICPALQAEYEETDPKTGRASAIIAEGDSSHSFAVPVYDESLSG
jgi:hypothetical protein